MTESKLFLKAQNKMYELQLKHLKEHCTYQTERIIELEAMRDYINTKEFKAFRNEGRNGK